MRHWNLWKQHFATLWKAVSTFYIAVQWILTVTKYWPENKEKMENIEFLHAQLSLARKIAVNHKNNILNDRIFLQISGKKQISAQPVIIGTTVHYLFYNYWPLFCQKFLARHMLIIPILLKCSLLIRDKHLPIFYSKFIRKRRSCFLSHTSCTSPVKYSIMIL